MGEGGESEDIIKFDGILKTSIHSQNLTVVNYGMLLHLFVANYSSG